MPAVRSATRYGSMKAPPPFSYATYGNRQMLPSPTAEPIAARMNTFRDENAPRDSSGAGVLVSAFADTMNSQPR